MSGEIAFVVGMLLAGIVALLIIALGSFRGR